MKLRSRDVPDFVPPITNLRWLEQLPAELLGLILRHASETADIDVYVDSANNSPYQSDLELMNTMIAIRMADVTHVCQLWRRIHIPEFYHYAVYDDCEDRLLVPEGCEQHIRWLLINVPRDSAPHFNVLRALRGLTPEVRKHITWLGLNMDTETAMLVSEYNQLAAAFPALQQVWLDTRRIVDLPAIYLKSAGAKALPPITSLVLQEEVFRRRDKVAPLVHAVAATLTRLELGHVDIGTACEVLWGPGGQADEYRSRFRQLAKLFISIRSVHDRPPIMPIHSAPELHGWMKQLVAMLLEHAPAQLRWLSIDDPDGDVLEMLGGKMQQLEALHLNHNLDYYHSMVSLQRVLETAGAIPKLKGLTADSYEDEHRSSLDLTCIFHPHLCVLDIGSWNVTLCDLHQLLPKLPRLERLRITLAPSEILPAREDIGQHMAMQWIWIGADIGADSPWDSDSLESLTTLLARMPRLNEAFLFSEADMWLTAAMAARNRDDLLYLEHHVQIGRSDN
ncbi:hypothetical protein IWQ56_000816 [Coemansia nantahalensis]|nr:hypothetical protein IWQ56_000816 [Coemansia nantahalensis]